MSNEAWNYFGRDPHYSDVLKERLDHGVEMDSAKALASYVSAICAGDLRIVDFGGGPGHYYRSLKKTYQGGRLRYTSVDIDESNISYGKSHFADDPDVSFVVGSVLSPQQFLDDCSCVVSANTLPHVPTIEPLLKAVQARADVRYFAFRLLIGQECVQIRKHLAESDFEGMFEQNFQFNNIYSLSYIKSLLGDDWTVEVRPDIFDVDRLSKHRLPAQDSDPFYANRVSRPVEGMIFKGDVFMPWKFLLGVRRPSS
jgi:SAM-dependent methyltransferase